MEESKTMEENQILHNNDKNKKDEIPEKFNSTDSTRPAAAEAETCCGELPQCKMGNRKVDNMSFMISCTNWY